MTPTVMMSPPDSSATAPLERGRKPGWYLWIVTILTLTGSVMTWMLMLAQHPVLGTLNAAALAAAWMLDLLWTLLMLKADFAAGLVDERQRARDTMKAILLVVVPLACFCGLVVLGWTLPSPPPTSIR